MQIEKKHWRVEFATHPKTDGFAYPHCIQRSSVTRGYRIRGATRVGNIPASVFKYTLSGKGIVEIDGFQYEVPQGDAFLVNVADPRVNYYFPEEENERWEFIFFTFNHSEKEVESINERFGFVYNISENSWLIRSLLNYRNRTQSMHLLRPGEAHTMVHTYLGELVDKNVAVNQTREKSSLFLCISELVQNHLEEKLTLNDVAIHLNVSKEHLSRVFKKETGMTVLEYIQREKVNYAKMLCQDRSLSIKEVGYRLGFANPSHFNRLFKKYTDMTPLGFRKHGSP